MYRTVTSARGAGTASGFSLLELLVASAAMLILLGGLTSLFATQNHAYKVTTDLVDARSSGRSALQFMMLEIKDAGYDVPATLSTVCAADATSIKMHGDWNGDRKVDQVIYEYDGAARKLYRRYLDGATAGLVDCTQQGAQELVADDVLSLTLSYYDNQLPAPAALAIPVPANKLTYISKVGIDLVVFTAEDGSLRSGALGVDVNPGIPGRARTRRLQSQVALRNLIYKMQ